MFRAFKQETLEDLISLENIDPNFLEAGGMEWWYADNVISFLIECFRIIYPDAHSFIKCLWERVAKRYNYPVAHKKRSDVLSYYFNKPWDFYEHLQIGMIFDEPWEKGQK